MEGEIPTADLIEIDWQLQQNPRLQALMLAPPGHDSQTAFSELHQFLFPPNPDPLGIPTDPRSALSIQPGAPVRSPGQTASDPLARKRGGGDATVPSLLLDARSFQTALAERVPEKHPEDSREMDPVFDAIRGEEIVNARSSQAVCRLLAKKPTPALPSSFTPPCPLPDSTQIPMSEITRLRMQLHEGFTDALSAADELLINPQTASLLGRRLKDYSPPPLRLVDATGGSTNPEEGGQVALAQRLLVSEMQSMRHRLKDIHDELDAARERAEERVRLKKGRGEVEEQCKGKERRDKTKQTDPTICPQGKAVQSVEKDFGWGGNFGNRPKLPSLRRVWDSPMAPPKVQLRPVGARQICGRKAREDFREAAMAARVLQLSDLPAAPQNFGLSELEEPLRLSDLWEDPWYQSLTEHEKLAVEDPHCLLMLQRAAFAWQSEERRQRDKDEEIERLKRVDWKRLDKEWTRGVIERHLESKRRTAARKRDSQGRVGEDRRKRNVSKEERKGMKSKGERIPQTSTEENPREKIMLSRGRVEARERGTGGSNDGSRSESRKSNDAQREGLSDKTKSLMHSVPTSPSHSVITSPRPPWISSHVSFHGAPQDTAEEDELRDQEEETDSPRFSFSPDEKEGEGEGEGEEVSPTPLQAESVNRDHLCPLTVHREPQTGTQEEKKKNKVHTQGDAVEGAKEVNGSQGSLKAFFRLPGEKERERDRGEDRDRAEEEILQMEIDRFRSPLYPNFRSSLAFEEDEAAISSSWGLQRYILETSELRASLEERQERLKALLEDARDRLGNVEEVVAERLGSGSLDACADFSAELLLQGERKTRDAEWGGNRGERRRENRGRMERGWAAAEEMLQGGASKNGASTEMTGTQNEDESLAALMLSPSEGKRRAHPLSECPFRNDPYACLLAERTGVCTHIRKKRRENEEGHDHMQTTSEGGVEKREDDVPERQQDEEPDSAEALPSSTRLGSQSPPVQWNDASFFFDEFSRRLRQNSATPLGGAPVDSSHTAVLSLLESPLRHAEAEAGRQRLRTRLQIAESSLEMLAASSLLQQEQKRLTSAVEKRVSLFQHLHNKPEDAVAIGKNRLKTQMQKLEEDINLLSKLKQNAPSASESSVPPPEESVESKSDKILEELKKIREVGEKQTAAALFELEAMRAETRAIDFVKGSSRKKGKGKEEEGKEKKKRKRKKAESAGGESEQEKDRLKAGPLLLLEDEDEESQGEEGEEENGEVNTVKGSEFSEGQKAEKVDLEAAEKEKEKQEAEHSLPRLPDEVLERVRTEAESLRVEVEGYPVRLEMESLFPFMVVAQNLWNFKKTFEEAIADSLRLFPQQVRVVLLFPTGEPHSFHKIRAKELGRKKENEGEGEGEGGKLNGEAEGAEEDKGSNPDAGRGWEYDELPPAMLPDTFMKEDPNSAMSVSVLFDLFAENPIKQTLKLKHQLLDIFSPLRQSSLKSFVKYAQLHVVDFNEGGPEAEPLTSEECQWMRLEAIKYRRNLAAAAGTPSLQAHIDREFASEVQKVYDAALEGSGVAEETRKRREAASLVKTEELMPESLKPSGPCDPYLGFVRIAAAREAAERKLKAVVEDKPDGSKKEKVKVSREGLSQSVERSRVLGRRVRRFLEQAREESRLHGAYENLHLPPRPLSPMEAHALKPSTVSMVTQEGGVLQIDRERIQKGRFPGAFKESFGRTEESIQAPQEEPSSPPADAASVSPSLGGRGPHEGAGRRRRGRRNNLDQEARRKLEEMGWNPADIRQLEETGRPPPGWVVVGSEDGKGVRGWLGPGGEFIAAPEGFLPSVAGPEGSGGDRGGTVSFGAKEAQGEGGRGRADVARTETEVSKKTRAEEGKEQKKEEKEKENEADKKKNRRPAPQPPGNVIRLLDEKGRPMPPLIITGEKDGEGNIKALDPDGNEVWIPPEIVAAAKESKGGGLRGHFFTRRPDGTVVVDQHVTVTTRDGRKVKVPRSSLKQIGLPGPDEETVFLPDGTPVIVPKHAARAPPPVPGTPKQQETTLIYLPDGRAVEVPVSSLEGKAETVTVRLPDGSSLEVPASAIEKAKGRKKEPGPGEVLVTLPDGTQVAIPAPPPPASSRNRRKHSDSSSVSSSSAKKGEESEEARVRVRAMRRFQPGDSPHGHSRRSESLGFSKGETDLILRALKDLTQFVYRPSSPTASENLRMKRKAQGGRRGRSLDVPTRFAAELGPYDDSTRRIQSASPRRPKAWIIEPLSHREQTDLWTPTPRSKVIPDEDSGEDAYSQRLPPGLKGTSPPGRGRRRLRVVRKTHGMTLYQGAGGGRTTGRMMESRSASPDRERDEAAFLLSPPATGRQGERAGRLAALDPLFEEGQRQRRGKEKDSSLLFPPEPFFRSTRVRSPKERVSADLDDLCKDAVREVLGLPDCKTTNTIADSRPSSPPKSPTGRASQEADRLGKQGAVENWRSYRSQKEDEKQNVRRMSTGVWSPAFWDFLGKVDRGEPVPPGIRADTLRDRSLQQTVPSKWDEGFSFTDGLDEY